ncbi:MAG: RidA family protein [Chloroflexota bacterium]
MKTRIQTDHAPAALGPYSQAIVTGNMVYTAGQTPIDPTTGKLIDGTIEEQTHRVLQNIKSVLDAAGSSLAKVVKTTVFLTSMSDFAAMNGIYAQYFNTDAPPARSTIQVAGLPLGAMIEIETVAILD